MDSVAPPAVSELEEQAQAIAQSVTVDGHQISIDLADGVRLTLSQNQTVVGTRRIAIDLTTDEKWLFSFGDHQRSAVRFAAEELVGFKVNEEK